MMISVTKYSFIPQLNPPLPPPPPPPNHQSEWLKQCEDLLAHVTGKYRSMECFGVTRSKSLAVSALTQLSNPFVLYYTELASF